MIGDYEIVEYTNPLFPDKRMYKCKVGNFEFQASNYGAMVDLVYEAIAKLGNKDYQAIKDKAVTSFFEGSNTPKD